MITREASERNTKFRPWLNENPYMDRSIPWAERGLRADAPEEARKAYADYLKDKEEEQRTGRKG
jgi:hypothetical protein